MPLDTDCVLSTFKNTSGTRKTFSFLPPHGRSLAANATITVFGGPDRVLARSSRSATRRNEVAFQAALARGDIQVLQTPAAVVRSPGGTVKTVGLADNGTLAASDPCWTTSDSA